MNNLKTGHVCFYRPNRSNPRYFGVCDVARIAQNCVDDTDTPPEVVMAFVAKQLGFTHISLSRESSKLAFVNPSKVVPIIIITAAQITRLAQTLGFSTIVALGATIISKLEELQQTIDEFFAEAPPQAIVETFVGDRECNSFKRTKKR